MLTELKETVEKVKKTMVEENGNINKDREKLKRNKKEILGLKSIIPEIKNSLEGFKAEFSRQNKTKQKQTTKKQ